MGWKTIAPPGTVDPSFAGEYGSIDELAQVLDQSALANSSGYVPEGMAFSNEPDEEGVIGQREMVLGQRRIPGGKAWQTEPITLANLRPEDAGNASLPDWVRARAAGLQSMARREEYSQDLGAEEYILDRLPFTPTSAVESLMLAAAKTRIKDGSASRADFELVADAEQKAYEESQKGVLRQAGDVVTQLPALGIEFAATGGAAGGMLRGANAARAARGIPQFGRAASAAFRAGSQAAMMPHRTAAATGEKLQEGDDIETALLKGFGDTLTEVATETIGGELVNRVGVKFGQTAIAQGLKNWFLQTKVGKGTGKLFAERKFTQALKDAGYNGLLAEFAEERMGDVIRGATGIEDGYGIFTNPEWKKQAAVELLAFAVPGAVSVAASQIPGPKQPLPRGEVQPEYDANLAPLGERLKDPKGFAEIDRESVIDAMAKLPEGTVSPEMSRSEFAKAAKKAGFDLTQKQARQFKGPVLRELAKRAEAKPIELEDIGKAEQELVQKIESERPSETVDDPVRAWYEAAANLLPSTKAKTYAEAKFAVDRKRAAIQKILDNPDKDYSHIPGYDEIQQIAFGESGSKFRAIMSQSEDGSDFWEALAKGPQLQQEKRNEQTEPTDVSEAVRIERQELQQIMADPESERYGLVQEFAREAAKENGYDLDTESGKMQAMIDGLRRLKEAESFDPTDDGPAFSKEQEQQQAKPVLFDRVQKSKEQKKQPKKTNPPKGEDTQRPAEGGGFAVSQGKTIRSVAPPEVYQLAKALGVTPKGKKLPEGTRGYFDTHTGEVVVSRELGSDPKKFAAILAHEVGHLIDWAENNKGKFKTLKHKKLLGKLAAIKKFTASTLDGLSEQDARAELIALSEFWRPYDKATADAKFIKYRESNTELYADFVSAMLNQPQTAKNFAPKVFESWLKNLGNKPETAKAYLEVQRVLNGQPAELAESRTETTQGMFKEGDRKYADYLAKSMQTASNIMEWAKIELLDKAVTSKKYANKAGQKQAAIVFDELYRKDNPNHVMLADIQQEVLDPLEAEGLGRMELGEWLFLNRIVNERNEILNPLAFTPQEASKQMAQMQDRLGSKFATLENAASKFNDIVFAQAKRAVRFGVYSKQKYKDTIVPNRKNYAAFAVLHYFEGNVSWQMKEQVGTLSEIANPFESTVLKMIALNRITEINRAAKELRNVLKSSFKDEISDVEHNTLTKMPSTRATNGMDHLRVYDNGNISWYEVPAELSAMFRSSDLGFVSGLADFMSSASYGVFHPLYVTFSPGFVAKNMFRDLRRTWLLLGSKHNISFWEVVRETWKEKGNAWARAGGMMDATKREMMKQYALDTPYVKIDAHVAEDEGAAKRLIQQYGITEKKPSANALFNAIGQFHGFVARVSEAQENAAKTAAWNMLKARGVPLQEAAHDVRKLAGTPDYKQRGGATQLTNAIFMYSKVRWNALAAEMELATGKHKSTYWMRMIVGTVIPAVLTRLALELEPLKSLMAKVPSYLLENYDIIPLWLTGEGDDEQLVFMTIPQHETQAMIRSMTMNAIDWGMESTGKNTRKEGVREPVGDIASNLQDAVLPSLNPILDGLRVFGTYMSNQNPVDHHFREQIIPQKQWDSGGWDSHRKLLAWYWQKTGTVKEFGGLAGDVLVGKAFDPKEQTTTEYALNNIPGLSSLVRVSNKGESEQLWSDIAEEKSANAKFNNSLPSEATKLSQERYALSKKRDKTTQDDSRLSELSAFYLRYLDMRKQIKAADAAGDKKQGEALRQQLKEIALEYQK